MTFYIDWASQSSFFFSGIFPPSFLTFQPHIVPSMLFYFSYVSLGSFKLEIIYGHEHIAEKRYLNNVGYTSIVVEDCYALFQNFLASDQIREDDWKLRWEQGPVH